MSEIKGKWKNGMYLTEKALLDEEVISMKQEEYSYNEVRSMSADYDRYVDMVVETFGYPTECSISSSDSWHEARIKFYIDRDEYDEQLKNSDTFIDWLNKLKKEKYDLHFTERKGKPYRFCDSCKEDIIDQIRDDYVERGNDLNESQILNNDFE